MSSRISRPPTWLVGLLLGLATLVAYSPRVAQYRDWQEHRAAHFAGQVMASNHDSYYWFREARELYSGEWQETGRDALRRHPDGVRSHRSWFSRSIAFAARWTGGDVYQAGLWLVLASSCLFVIPLGLYAASAGWPAAGLLAGLIGAASQVVVIRTSIHRVDTDPVNLFALWWICFAFTLPRPDRAPWKQLASAMLAGVSVALFVAWYEKPGFLVVLAVTFGLCLFARRFATRRMAQLGAVFLLCANPLTLERSGQHLFQTGKHFLELSLQTREPGPHLEGAENAAAAPDSGVGSASSPLEKTSFLVSEKHRLPPGEALGLILSPAWLAGVGLLAFASWAARNWRLAVPLAPLCVLGAMGLFTARRFLMYLAPLAGFGLGIVLSIAVRSAMRRTRFSSHAESVACCLSFVAFAAVLPATSYDLRPRAAIPTATVASLQRCARELPPGSVVWHSWGYGYLVQDVMGAATYTDGGGAQPVIDHVLVKALTGTNAEALQRTIAYLNRHPQRDVIAAFLEDYPAAYQRLRESPPDLSNPSFVLLTPRSLRDFNAYAHRGQWDFASRQPGWVRIRRLRCTSSKPPRLQCKDRSGRAARIDLQIGFIEDATEEGRRRFLAKAVTIREGFAHSARRYPHASGHFLVLLPKTHGRVLDVYLMPPAAFRSNLVQLYLLGRPDERFMELVCDDFPSARLYRVK